MPPILTGAGTLSEEYIAVLAAEIDSEDYAGILLGGSYARGEATTFSDLDLACIVSGDSKLRDKWFFYREGKLVSCGVKSVEGIRANLKRPEMAIVVARGIGDCRVLIDKDGSVTALLEEVRRFSWEPLREAANRQAGYRLMMAAELALKIANETSKGNDPAVALSAARLLAELTTIVAIAFGVLVKSDSTYYSQVREVAGVGSSWTHHHHFVAGEDTESQGDVSVRAKGLAALMLYGETYQLIEDKMEPEHRLVVEETIRIVQREKLIQD